MTCNFLMTGCQTFDITTLQPLSPIFLYQDPPFKVIQAIMGGCKGRYAYFWSVDKMV